MLNNRSCFSRNVGHGRGYEIVDISAHGLKLSFAAAILHRYEYSQCRSMSRWTIILGVLSILARIQLEVIATKIYRKVIVILCSKRQSIELTRITLYGL